jgi:hypothetical protein
MDRISLQRAAGAVVEVIVKIPVFMPWKLFIANIWTAILSVELIGMAKQIDAQIGQQYEKVKSRWNPPPVWEVNFIYPDDAGISHVCLMNLANPQDRKTVSISALLDKKRFRLVGDVSAAA